MRLPLMLLVLAAAVALSVALYALSGGRVLFFGLPLLFAVPLAWPRRR